MGLREMMFEPPRCPWTDCPAHTDPEPGFCRRKGFYHPKCRPHPVPRFYCKVCERSFSRQTFRADYFDKRPDLNSSVMRSLCSGVGLRQTARNHGVSYESLVLKARKISRHCGWLHQNLIGRLDGGEPATEFAFDEAETFEGSRADCPVTVPVMIHQETMFVVGAEVGTLPPRRKAARVRERQHARARERGREPANPPARRRNESRAACARVFEAAARHCGEQTRVLLRSDMKSTYPGLAKKAFGERLVSHMRISSKMPRGSKSSLHRINLMLAMFRDLVSRLRRRSWLVSKRREQLKLHLDMHVCYRNYHRRRFNADPAEDTPARLLGILPRPLTLQQILSWRQDFGRSRSLHPLSMGQARAACVPDSTLGAVAEAVAVASCSDLEPVSGP